MPTQPRPLPMVHAHLITLALLMGAATLLSAAEKRAAHEEEAANASTPVVTLLGGMKDFEVGAQGEYSLSRGRFSVFAGVGYVVPDPDVEERAERQRRTSVGSSRGRVVIVWGGRSSGPSQPVACVRQACGDAA
jgi:hypothetical protein